MMPVTPAMIFLPFLVALLVTLFFTPIFIKINTKLGLVDDPKKHKHPGIIHTKPIPRGGGIPLFLGTFVASVLFLPINLITISLFVACSLILVIGTIDDKLNANTKDVSPYVRFFVIILCGIIVVGSGVTIPFITNPLGGILHLPAFSFGFLSLAVTDVVAALWIIWVVNMLNWSKGVDGQMPGIVTISALTIGILSLRFPVSGETATMDTTLSFIIAGSMLGFLFFNFYPAKIFPGYGASAMYLLLAVVSILSSAKLATAILVMGVPAADAGFTILRRIISKKSPFLGDNLHLHHLLLRLNYSQRQIALFYWTISAILGAVSLTLQSRSKLFAIIMLFVIILMILLFLHRVLRQAHETTT